jgi:hypothetical protein
MAALTAPMRGSPDFKIIDIDPISVANALQEYLQRGSRLTGVSLDDLNLAVLSLPPNMDKVNLVGLLELGMKLFDAIVWLSAGRPATHPLTQDPGLTAANVPSLHKVARAVFYVYFFLLTQARYPPHVSTGDAGKVPNFLQKIMGMEDPPHTYTQLICSFEPQKFDPKWAQHVNFAGLGQEVLSRFGLGVAGYRLFGPFKLYNPKKTMDLALANPVEFARTIARSEPSWAIHPLTRSPATLTKRGNLNKNLGNLILDVFTDEQIDEMVASKILFAKPKREPTCREYLQWQAIDDISAGNRIFPATDL